MIDTCSEAAVREGLTLGSAPNCLVAQVRFSSKDTGSDVAECGPNVGWGVECEAQSVFRKDLKLTLSEPVRGAVVMEVDAAFASSSHYFSRESVLAPCTAAFRGYPQPTRHEKIDVSL
jgi:hypothetical protein